MQRALLLSLLMLPGVAFGACPKGTAEVVDASGLPNCISVTPKESPKAPSLETCPVGSVRYSDFNGKAVCRNVGSGQEIMNFQVSCPLGTFPTTDVSGTRVCQKR